MHSTKTCIGPLNLVADIHSFWAPSYSSINKQKRTFKGLDSLKFIDILIKNTKMFMDLQDILSI